MNAPVIEGLSEEFIRKNEKYLKIILERDDLTV